MRFWSGCLCDPGGRAGRPGWVRLLRGTRGKPAICSCCGGPACCAAPACCALPRVQKGKARDVVQRAARPAAACRCSGRSAVWGLWVYALPPPSPWEAGSRRAVGCARARSPGAGQAHLAQRWPLRMRVCLQVLRRNYGPEADVWSLGVVLYILLSGARGTVRCGGVCASRRVGQQVEPAGPALWNLPAWRRPPGWCAPIGAGCGRASHPAAALRAGGAGRTSHPLASPRRVRMRLLPQGCPPSGGTTTERSSIPS